MPQVLFFWFLGGPLVTRAAGYLPGRLLGLGADLPAGVYRQWRRWCLSADFNRRDRGGEIPMPDLAAFRGEVTLVAIADGEFVPPERVRLTVTSYPAARLRHVEVHPKELGLERIGHLRLLSARGAGAWPALFDPA